MRHDCVLAAQLESVSEGDDGAGTEESSADEEGRIADIAVIAGIAGIAGIGKGKSFLTAEDAKGAKEIGKGKSLPLINADERGSGKDRRDRRHRTSSPESGEAKPYR